MPSLPRSILGLLAPARSIASRTLCTMGAVAAMLAGCGDPQGGTDVGNGATIDLDLTAYRREPASQPAAITLGSGARVDELWMVIERVRMRPGTDCEAEDTRVDVEGPLVADLIGGGVLGGPARFAVTPGPFCRLRVDFHKLEAGVPAGAPAELAGLSVRMRGARADGTPFTVESRSGEELELGAKDGSFAIAAGDQPLFLAYELDALLASLDLDALPASPIVVNDDSEEARLDAFEDALFDAARLFRDDDHDGSLGAFEHEDGAELAR